MLFSCLTTRTGSSSFRLFITHALFDIVRLTTTPFPSALTSLPPFSPPCGHTRLLSFRHIHLAAHRTYRRTALLPISVGRTMRSLTIMPLSCHGALRLPNGFCLHGRHYSSHPHTLAPWLPCVDYLLDCLRSTEIEYTPRAQPRYNIDILQDFLVRSV